MWTRNLTTNLIVVKGQAPFFTASCYIIEALNGKFQYISHDLRQKELNLVTDTYQDQEQRLRYSLLIGLALGTLAD